MNSTLNVDTCDVLDTLNVTTNIKLGSGTLGSVLVDDGTNVIQPPRGPDGYILTYDSTVLPQKVTYKPYTLVSSNIKIPIIGGFATSAGSTIYSKFNIEASSSSMDFYSVPFNCTITQIDIITLPNSGNFSWPGFTSTRYYKFTMGYMSGGTFTAFPATTIPNFTIGPSTAPIVGVPNYDRATVANLYTPVSFTVPDTWTVTPGTHITLRLEVVGTLSSMLLMPVIYLYGAF